MGPTAGCYSARNAQRKTAERHAHKTKALKFNVSMKQVAFAPLATNVYQWIWGCKHGNKRANQPFKRLYQDLRHGHGRRKRGLRSDSRSVITCRVSIENRPAIVQSRKRIGDIEVDLMMGKNHQGALLVMTDRATLHTLTFDNDKAFAGHRAIGLALGLETYFTRPYTSQDKGTVENRIGQIRCFPPKLV